MLLMLKNEMNGLTLMEYTVKIGQRVRELKERWSQKCHLSHLSDILSPLGWNLHLMK
jgi:hypothetical protein